MPFYVFFRKIDKFLKGSSRRQIVEMIGRRGGGRMVGEAEILFSGGTLASAEATWGLD